MPVEREIWESINDLIIERAEAIMYEGGIQALELLKADKRTIKILEEILKKEEAFANWLQKNNPRRAKRNEKAAGRKEEKGKGRNGRVSYYYCHNYVRFNILFRPFFVLIA